MCEEKSDFVGKEIEECGIEPCFPGDMGRLPREARLVLTALVKRAYIDSNYNPALWKALIENKDEVAAALNDLFLELDLREDIGIAAAVQVDDVGFNVASRLKDAKPLTGAQAQVLAFLLELYWSKRFDGADSVFFPLDEVERELSSLVRQGEDDVKATDVVRRAVNALRERGIVREASGLSVGSNVWQVLPVVEFFDRDAVSAAIATYKQVMGETEE